MHVLDRPDQNVEILDRVGARDRGVLASTRTRPDLPTGTAFDKEAAASSARCDDENGGSQSVPDGLLLHRTAIVTRNADLASDFTPNGRSILRDSS